MNTFDVFEHISLRFWQHMSIVQIKEFASFQI